MNYDDILQLIDRIENSSFEEFEIDFKGTKLKLSKSETNSFSSSTTQTLVSEEITEIEKTEIVEEVETPTTIMPKEKEEITGTVVKSPIVGTFYSSQNPESESFVKLGSMVNTGETLCIIEAMKVMNEVISPYTGKIVEILAKDEDLVDFNKPLFVIEEI